MIHFNGVCRSQFASPLCPFWFWIHFHLPLFLFFWGSQLSTNWGKRQCNSTAPEISSLLLATSSRASDWFISIWILSKHLAIVLKETKFQKTVKKDFGVKKRVFKNKAIDIRVQLNPNTQILQNRNLFFMLQVKIRLLWAQLLHLFSSNSFRRASNSHSIPISQRKWRREK